MNVLKTERGLNRLLSLSSRRWNWSDGDSTRATTEDGSTKQDPRLSFFIPNLTVGGAERVVVNIINGLSDRGYNVELVLSEQRGELLSDVDPQITITELSPDPVPALGVATHLPSLTAYLYRKEPTVLFTHLTQASVVALSAKQILGSETAVIPTHHVATNVPRDETPKTRVLQRLTARLYPRADRIISVSNCVGETVIEGMPVVPADISVLHNPVEISSVRDRATDPVEHEWIEDDETDVVLFVGRIEEQKDLDTWLRAFKKVHEQKPDTRGVIVGQGERREEIIALADRLGLEEYISIPGYVDNPYRYMHQAAVFLLASRSEGLPTVLIEALACGCPIVSTDCRCGPSEILAGGEYGRLAPVGDSDAISNAVIAELADPVPSEQLRQRAEDFSPESILEQYEEFIETHVLSG